MPEMGDDDDEALIRDLTSRLQQADELIKHLQAAQGSAVDQITALEAELELRRTEQAEYQNSMQRMEAGVEDLLAFLGLAWDPLSGTQAGALLLVGVSAVPSQ